VFPASGSLLAAPPFPRSGPGEPGSPTSAVLRGRYDFPLTYLPVAYWFAPGPHAILLWFVLAVAGAPGRPEVPSRARIIGQPVIPIAGGLRVDVSGISQVPRRSILCLCPAPGPRPDRCSLANSRLHRCCPCSLRKQRLQRNDNIEAYDAALAPAVYASRAMLPPPMQDSLPAGWLAFTGRASNPLDRDERFPIATSLPPFLGLS